MRHEHALAYLFQCEVGDLLVFVGRTARVSLRLLFQLLRAGLCLLFRALQSSEHDVCRRVEGRPFGSFLPCQTRLKRCR